MKRYISIPLLFLALTAGCSFFRPTNVPMDEDAGERDAGSDVADTCASSVWFVDADEDGFGSSEGVKESCTQPEGYVQSDTDCDDRDELRNPDATEVCNGRDDDCDGDTDEGCEGAVDDDGDGYCRGPDEEVQGAVDCAMGGGDCDDTRDDVHPGAPERCGAVDYDCDESLATPQFGDVVGLGPVRPQGILETFARLGDQFAVAWAERTTTGRRVRAAVIGPRGALEAGPISLSDERGWIDRVAISADPVTQTFAVTWAGYDPAAGRTAVFVARISDTAVVEQEATRVDDSVQAGFAPTPPILTVTDGQGTVGIFYEKDDAGNRALYYIAFDVENESFGEPKLISTEIPTGTMSAVYDPEPQSQGGSFNLVWREYDSTQTPRQGWGFLKVLPDGRVSGSIRRHRSDESVLRPAIYRLNDRFYLSWVGERVGTAWPMRVSELNRGTGQLEGPVITLGTDARYISDIMLGYDPDGDDFAALYPSREGDTTGMRLKYFGSAWNLVETAFVDEASFFQELENTTLQAVDGRFVALDDSADSGHFKWWEFQRNRPPRSSQPVTGQAQASPLETTTFQSWSIPGEDFIRTADREDGVWELVDIEPDGTLSAHSEVPVGDDCSSLLPDGESLFCWGYQIPAGASCGDPDNPVDILLVSRKWNPDAGEWSELFSKSVPSGYSPNGCPAPIVYGADIDDEGALWLYQRRLDEDFNNREFTIQTVTEDSSESALLDVSRGVGMIAGEDAALVYHAELVETMSDDGPRREKLFARVARKDGTVTEPVEIGERQPFRGVRLPRFFNGEYFVFTHQLVDADRARVRWLDADGELAPQTLEFDSPVVQLQGDGRPGHNAFLFNREGRFELFSFDDRGEVLSTSPTGYFNPHSYYTPGHVHVFESEVRFLVFDFETRIVYGRGNCAD